MTRKFLGPVWPCVGPDYRESVERFRPEFLERECSRDLRVVEYLTRLKAWEDLPERIARLERQVECLARPPKSKASRRMEGVPL